MNDGFVNYAHRGASSYAPENSMVSFKKAVQLGANGIELDLQKTKDGKIVIFHDDLIDKKSNGSGKISDYNYQELYKLDFGSWFDEKFKGEHIVLFEDFAKNFLNLDLTFAIELKVDGVEKEVLNIINKYKTHDNIFITSFNYRILQNVRKLDKKVKLSWLVDKINQDNINRLLKINGKQICPNAAFVTTDDISLAKVNKLSVRLWGIQDENHMKKVFHYDIEGMTVNFPDKLLKIMNENTHIGGRKNILIMGIGRAGKTTLSNMLKNKINSYNLIHSDSLKWAMIRAIDKEKYYRENVEKQKEFEHSETFQRTLLNFFNSSIQNDNKEYGYILESGQLHPKIVKEMIDFEHTIVVCLGLGDLSIDDIVTLCQNHDKEEDWSYGLSRDYLKKHAKDWYHANEVLKKECPKYGIPYFDTSSNRNEILNKLMKKIISMIQT